MVKVNSVRRKFSFSDKKGTYSWLVYLYQLMELVGLFGELGNMTEDNQ